MLLCWRRDVLENLGCKARLAQSVERKALNLVVVGSSPTVGVLRSLICSQHMQTRTPRVSPCSAPEHFDLHLHDLPSRIQAIASYADALKSMLKKTTKRANRSAVG